MTRLEITEEGRRQLGFFKGWGSLNSYHKGILRFISGSHGSVDEEEVVLSLLSQHKGRSPSTYKNSLYDLLCWGFVRKVQR